MDFSLVCNWCGSALEGEWSKGRYDIELKITPCDTCQEDAKEEGRKEAADAD